MTNVLNKSVSLLLSAIMVVCLLAVPVIPSLEVQAAEADLIPASNYTWNFDNAVLNTKGARYTTKDFDYGYDSTTGRYLMWWGSGPSSENGNIILDDANSHVYNTGNSNGAFELVSDGNGGKFARLSSYNRMDMTSAPVYRIELPEALTGNVSIEFDVRLCKIDASGNAVPFADTDSTTRSTFFKVNNGKPYISHTPKSAEYVLNYTWANPNISALSFDCVDETHEYATSANVLKRNVNTAEFTKIKVDINTAENYATFDNMKCDKGHLLKIPADCADGVKNFQFGFNDANVALGENEYTALDFDNVKISYSKPLASSKLLSSIDFEDVSLKGGADSILARYNAYNDMWGKLIDGNDLIAQYEGTNCSTAYYTLETTNGNTVLKAVSDPIGRVKNGKGETISTYPQIALRPQTGDPFQGKIAIDMDIQLTYEDADGNEHTIPYPNTFNASNLSYARDAIVVNYANASGNPTRATALGWQNSRIESAQACTISPCGESVRAVMWQDLSSKKGKIRIIIDTVAHTMTFATWNGTTFEPLYHDYDVVKNGVQYHRHQVTVPYNYDQIKDIRLFNYNNYDNVPAAIPDLSRFVWRFDNIKFTQLYDTVPTPAANIANNAKAVSIAQNFEVDFGMDITEDEKAAVKLLKNGAEVAATKNVVGTKVILDPEAELLPGTHYTLSVAPITRRNGSTAEQNINFYTAKDYTIAFADFEGITTTTENQLRSAMNRALKTDGTYSDGYGMYYTTNPNAVTRNSKLGTAQNDVDFNKIENGKYITQNALPTSGQYADYSGHTYTYSANQYIWYQKTYGYERAHIEYELALTASANASYATPYAIQGVSGELASMRYNGNLKLAAQGLADPLNKGPVILESNELKGTYKFVWDIDIPAGYVSVKVYNLDGTLKREVSWSKGSAFTTAVRGSIFTCLTSPSTNTGTTVVGEDGVEYYVNRMEVDNYRIEYRPVPGAMFTTPTSNLPTNVAPVIEFKTPVADVSAMKLYKVDGETETLVEDAEFTLSADGYTCEITATLEGETEYRVRHTGLVDVNGETVPESLGFLTAPKAPSVTMAAGLYTDSGLTTQATALTKDATLYAKVDFTNNENFAAHKAVIYVAVYDANGNLLLATATEENILAKVTKTLKLSFKVPQNAASVRVFAWDKWLTPYCEAVDVFPVAQ